MKMKREDVRNIAIIAQRGTYYQLYTGAFELE